MSETTSLKQKLGVEPARPRVVAECVTLVDSQVKAKSGLGGVAVKGAYGTVKRIKKRFVPEVVDALLDEWLDQLDPYFDAWNGAGSGSFAEYLTARSDEVAVTRMSRTSIRGNISRLEFEYLVGREEGIEHLSEVHELGLFPGGLMEDAFRQGGLEVSHDPEGLMGRGLYIARKP